MDIDHSEISVRGKTIKVPSTRINGRTVIVTGKWIKLAAVKDEELVEGETVEDTESLISKLKEGKLKADIFTFAQKLPCTTPKHKYHLEWDNAAVVPITKFKDWWEKRAEYDVRKAVKKAAKLGVIVNAVEFNDALVHGIQDVYNESPIRQGKAFWHYRKDFDTVKRENSTYLERSEFIGAYYHGELIGFIRMVYVGKIARTLQVISKKKHYDKKSTNALLAKAIEICEQKGVSQLVYGNYIYNDQHNPLTEFKRRNGFEQVLLPRYYVPLTSKGKVVLKLRLHHGIKRLLPESVLSLLLNVRSRIYKSTVIPLKPEEKSESPKGAGQNSSH
jgi:hypothetical protein